MHRNVFGPVPALVMAGLLTACLAACGSRQGPAGLYGEDHKLRADITLEEIRSAEVVHGDLIGVTYSHGGGMNGDTDSLALTRDGDHEPLIRTSKAAYHSFPLVVREYRAEESLFRTLEDLIQKDNLTLWADLPEAEFYALDGPSTSLSLIYDEKALGGSSYQIYTIRYDDIIPEGGYEILRAFTRALGEGIREDSCLDRYFEWGGERIDIGRDMPGTEEEISLLVSGFWMDPEGEKAGRTLTLFEYGLEDPMDFRFREEDRTAEWPLSVREILHEPWEEADCGWQVRLEDEEGENWILYMEDLSLKLVREDGSASFSLERQN